jgi:hypothetical protein
MTKRRVFDVFEWLGRHEFMVLLALLTVVAGTWGFIALTSWQGIQFYAKRKRRLCAIPEMIRVRDRSASDTKPTQAPR